MSSAMTVPVRVPWRAGSAAKLGRWMMVTGGPLASIAGSRINRLRMNSACQAVSENTVTGMA
jgi:hypothetical protein